MPFESPLSDRFTTPLLPPTPRASLNTFRTTQDLVDLNEAGLAGRQVLDEDYGRYGNDLERFAEQALAKLEGAESAVLVPSGMAAVTHTLLTLCAKLPEGSEILLGDEVYRQTRNFCEVHLRGVKVKLCPANSGDEVAKYITPQTKIIFLECPSNPFLSIPDIESIARVAKSAGITTIVDSTLASPFNVKPLEFGIDIVVQSATKYLGGHHDLIAGAIFGGSETMHLLRQSRGMFGTIAAPHIAGQLERYLTTFEYRVARHNQTGLEIARFLEEQPEIERVWYPGLSSHPDHDVAKKLFSGFGGVVTFTVKGNQAETSYFIDKLSIPRNGPSFGGPEALIEQVALISHYSKTEEQRQAIGISSNLIRLSVGFASVDELKADLRQSLDKLSTRQKSWRGFDKSVERFPCKGHAVVLNSCFVSPTNVAAVIASNRFSEEVSRRGTDALDLHTRAKQDFRDEVGKLLRTAPTNISIVTSCAAALSQLAEGYPFRKGDEIVGYEIEYPSNYNCWANQERRGVHYKTIKGSYQDGRPTSWSLEELEQAITNQTRIVAISHAQFINGYTADLKAVGEICKARGVSLVVDAAQTVGARPIYPDDWDVDAVVAPGHKWLAGKIGCGFLYTSPRFRKIIRDVLTGPDATTCKNYLERGAELHEDGRKFEPGTVNSEAALALAVAIQNGVAPYGPQKILSELVRLQDYVVAGIDTKKWIPVVFSPENRSGILALTPLVRSDGIVDYLKGNRVLASERGGYLRIAPPHHVTEAELDHVIRLLNEWNG